MKTGTTTGQLIFNFQSLECDEQFADLPDSDVCDPNEAPEGYYAVSFSDLSIKRDGSNLCNLCDWRKVCQDPTTDSLVFGYRCGSRAVRSRKDGKLYRRRDRCFVHFKKKALGLGGPRG